MKIANVAGRATVVTGPGQGMDVASASAGAFGPGLPGLFHQWGEFRAWVAGVTLGAPEVTFTPGELGPPSPSPVQVFAVGLNYRDHAAETGAELPPEPLVFTKFQSSLTGPATVVALPTGTVDWEVELTVVIGREAVDVSEADAWAHVAGLTVGQDISERTLQLVGAPPQFSLAKSYRGFSPTGPCLVTPDEFGDADRLEIGCAVNGVTVQKSSTSELIFPVPALIAKLSAVTRLYPGDLIFTGTPAGVGIGRKPRKYLAPGDELVSYVEGIGELRQRFVAQEGKS
jgi:2,4-didehydro-3-deoxy-L-rhamnonate hydrolase